MKTNIPKLRFVEFKDAPAWEEKKFGEVVKVNQGLQISIDERKTNYEPELYFYITNEVLKNDGQVYYIEEPSKSVICSSDDILMTRTGNTGMVVTGVNGVFHNNFFKIDYKQYFDKAYLVQSLEGNRIQNRIKRLAGQSTIPDLNHSDFYSIPISIPIIDEQNIIGKFLSTLDKRIELQEKLIEKLEEEKKGYSQKLFPMKDRSVPELRFIEFKNFGEWKSKKFGETFEILNGLSGKKKEDFTDLGNSKYITFRSIHKKKISPRDLANVQVDISEKQNAIKRGDLVITNTSENIDEISVVNHIDFDAQNVYLNSFSSILRSKENNLFFKYYLESPYIRGELMKNAQGITRFNSSYSRVAKIVIKFPLYKEQKCLANMISCIDERISSSEMKLKMYASQKKYYIKNILSK